jgi:phosphoadenosine phosphosulfate reductase
MSVALHFSGGKDSTACLYLLRDRWDEILVVWCNTGAAFPETVAQMEEVRKMVPHFLEVRTEQRFVQDGYPADVVPSMRTEIGMLASGKYARKFQSRFSCCTSALWQPMHDKMKELNVTTIIRGQKNCDELRSPVKHGEVVDGIRYEFPIRAWSDDDVIAFLVDLGVAIPKNYAYGYSGLDCWNCTAYLKEHAEIHAYMRDVHPEKHAQVVEVLRDLDGAITAETLHLKEMVHGF